MQEASSIRRYVPPTAIMNGRAALSYIDDVAVMVTVVQKWSEQDVIELLENSARLGNRVTAPGAITHFLGETLGTSASQRKMIVDWMEKNGIEPTPKTITLTDSTLIRAALTAYSWLTRTEAKAFKSSELDSACGWLCQGLLASPAQVSQAVQECYKLVGHGSRIQNAAGTP